MKILIGCTGSVATIKVKELVDQLNNRAFEVQVIATEHAQHFLKKESTNCKVWSDEDEWKMWNDRGDPVLHIEYVSNCSIRCQQFSKNGQCM